VKFQIVIKRLGAVLNTVKSPEDKFPWALLRANLEQLIQDGFSDIINLEISRLDSDKSTSETSIR
jgi:hypothetical protein